MSFQGKTCFLKPLAEHSRCPVKTLASGAVKPQLVISGPRGRPCLGILGGSSPLRTPPLSIIMCASFSSMCPGMGKKKAPTTFRTEQIKLFFFLFTVGSIAESIRLIHSNQFWVKESLKNEFCFPQETWLSQETRLID